MIRGSNEAFHERVYAQLRELDKEGKLPVYIDGCYILTNPYKLEEVMEGLKRFHREYTTEQEGFSHNKPSEVYFGGKKRN